MSLKSNARKMKNQEVLLSVNESTLLYLRAHPTIAAKLLLNIRLNWIQRLALRGVWTIPFSMLVWGRRNGKTFVGAIISVLLALLYPNQRVVIACPSKRQVDFIFLNEIMMLYNNSDYFKGSVKGKIAITNAYNRVVFSNGSVIEGFPVGAEGGKIRGAGASFLWIDEYAQMSESIIKMVFKPMLFVEKANTFNRYLITSSAYYRWNHLWDLFQYYKIKQAMEPKKYFVLNFNYNHLLLSKRLPVKFNMDIVQEAKDTTTEGEFAMEWEACFPANIEGFFSSELIDKCTPKPPDNKPIDIELEGDGKSDYYMGIDVGRAEGGSNFAISIIKLKGKIGKLVNVHTENGATFQVMIELIRKKVIDFNIRKICLDAGGGGLTIKDLLREPWIDYRTNQTLRPIITIDDTIQGIPILNMVNFTDEIHNKLHMNLKSEMEHRRLLFPIDIRRDANKELERAGLELVSFKNELRVMTAKPKGKFLRFEVPNKFRTDRVISTALALNCYLGDLNNNMFEEELPCGRWVSF